MTIEEKLDALARCGLKLKDQFGVADLAESWGREALDEPGWNLTLVCLGMTQEEPLGRRIATTFGTSTPSASREMAAMFELPSAWLRWPRDRSR